MSTIRVEIVSAEQEIWSGEGTMVFAPGVAGELGIDHLEKYNESP